MASETRREQTVCVKRETLGGKWFFTATKITCERC